jgi:hypothetical protein
MMMQNNTPTLLAIFDCHGDAAVQCGLLCSMDHILDFTRSHWMPPSGECLGHIAPVAAMVNDFQ